MTAGSGGVNLLGREESPDSIGRQCRVTPGEGNLRDSATENRPPSISEVRVKRWSKRPPRKRQRERHGKPHWEQCQIGVSCEASRKRRHHREVQARETRVGSLSVLVTMHLEEWSSTAFAPEQNPAYRPSVQINDQCSRVRHQTGFGKIFTYLTDINTAIFALWYQKAQ